MNGRAFNDDDTTTSIRPGKVVNAVDPESYKYASPLISERALDQPRPLKVVYIGAGISGILAAIKFRKTVPDIDLVIYEKNPELGGTWYENKYPGCACGRTLSSSSSLLDLIEG